MRFSVPICLVLGLFAGRAESATLNAASSSFSDVSAAVAAANRGDTVLVPAGSSTWPSTLTLSRGIRLLGSGRSSTIITYNGSTALNISPDATAFANQERIEVQGFTFDVNSTGVIVIHVEGPQLGATQPWTNLVIGNNTLRNMLPGTTVGAGAFHCNGQVRGVVYSNIFDRCTVVYKIMGRDDPSEWAGGLFPQSYGTADSLFIEGNTIQFSTVFVSSDAAWVESGQSARVVVRYNTWNMTNSTPGELWDCHGFQYWPGGETGTKCAEFYGNRVLCANSPYRWFSHRSPWGLYFDNSFVSASGSTALEVNQYSGGCTADVPGASGVYTTEINNSYFFNNTVNGVEKPTVIGLNNFCGLAENINFWNYTASFNGTVGIGRGTVAPSGNASPNVGYWVCGTPGPTTDPSVIQSGTLYKCVSPNVWAPYYRPFTFPHPLASGGVVGGSTNPVLAVSGSSDFGTVSAPSTNTITLVVANLGGGTLTGSASGLSAPFGFVGSSSYSLASNASQSITVVFTPAASGSYTQSIVFSGGGGTSVSVRGTATAVLPGLSFPASSGVVTAPFAINPDGTVSQSVQTTDPTQGGQALYDFTVSTSDTYYISANVLAPNDGANSIFVNVDAQPISPDMIWDIPVTPVFIDQLVTWRSTGGVSPQGWPLSGGPHQLVIRGREAGVMLQGFTLVTRPPVPQGLRVVSGGP